MDLKKFLLPFSNRKAFGETEAHFSKLAMTVAISVVIVLFATSIFLIFKSGQSSIANSNAKQIQNENSSITR